MYNLTICLASRWICSEQVHQGQTENPHTYQINYYQATSGSVKPIVSQVFYSWLIHYISWNALSSFYQSVWHIDPVLPISSHNFSLFITHLSSSRYAAPTIHTYISAVGYFHKLKGMHNPAAQFLPRKLLESVDKIKPPKPSLLLISLQSLNKIVNCLNTICITPYDTKLYKALFLSLYYMCARVGELASSHNNTLNMLQLEDMSITKQQDQFSHFSVSFSNFKHNKKSTIHSIQIKPRPWGPCPVAALKEYLSVRGTVGGPLFIAPTGGPVQAQQVSKVLHKALLWIGENPHLYSTHSFRVGRCTDLAKNGTSHTQLRIAGRWHSDAFLKYIRPHEFNV